MTSCLCSVCINYPSSTAITPDAAWHLWKTESCVRTLIKGKCDWNGVVIRAWQGPAVSMLHPFAPMLFEVGTGLADLDFFKGNRCNQTIDVVNDSHSARSQM